MNQSKPVPPSSAKSSVIPAPKKRFRLEKLEERIAPKGPPFSRKCKSF